MGAVRVAEKVRKQILDAPWNSILADSGLDLTVSIGVGSVIPSARDDTDRLKDEVDKALYVAKAEGRNRVASAGDLVAPAVLVPDAN